MKKLVAMTGETMNTAMYLTRVVTFNFATNGIGVPFFRKIKYNCVAN